MSVRLLGVISLAACQSGVGLDDGATNPNAVDCDGSDPWTAGLSGTTDRLGRTVTIEVATPAPPDVGDNSWQISIADAAGPVSGLAPVVTPWMPLHGHGLTPADYAGSEGALGTYQIATFDVIMPGLWEFTVDTEAGAGEPDVVTFALCAEG